MSVEDESLRTRIEALVSAGTVRRKIAACSSRPKSGAVKKSCARPSPLRVAPPRGQDPGRRAVARHSALDGGCPHACGGSVCRPAGIHQYLGAAEPQQVVPLLNEFFSLLTEITFRHDGTVFHMAGTA